MKKKKPTKSKYEEKTKSIPFYNGKGDRIYIPLNYTIEDILKMGVREIRLEKRGSFLPEGWYTTATPKRSTK